MRVWIYGTDLQELQAAARYEDMRRNQVIGVSVQGGTGAAFPNGGLIPALDAAVRGKIDLLAVSASALSGNGHMRIGEMQALFSAYHVSVISFSSSDKSNS